MDEGSITSVLIILFLLFFAAYFAVCETSFASTSRIKYKTGAEHGDSRAKKALYVADNFDKAITTILIGTNITHLAAASYVTVIVTRRWGVNAVTLSTIITTIVVFFVAEMLPKSISKKYSERLSLTCAASLCFFMRILTPVSYLLTAIGNAFARLTKGDEEVTVTEDELHDIIETMTDDGELEEELGELVGAALSFGEISADSIITARVDLDAIDISTPLSEMAWHIKTASHSRLPVYEGSVDNIIGILQVRRFIKAWLSDGDATDIRALLDEPFYVHSSTAIDELLALMTSHRCNLAVVTDSYGGTLGIVTVEDILEELVGEIWDEEDEVVETMIKNPDDSYSFDAAVDIEDAFDFMDYEDPDDFDFEHKLLGEWAYEQFGAIPSEGDSFTYNGLNVRVEQIHSRRIIKLNIKPSASEEREGGEQA